jgi:hypothetical protein
MGGEVVKPPLGRAPFLPMHDHQPEEPCHEPCAVAQWERYQAAHPERGLVLTAEETVWAWWGMEALARDDELRPHEERLRERLRLVIGASTTPRPRVTPDPAETTTVRELEVTLEQARTAGGDVGYAMLLDALEEALAALRRERGLNGLAEPGSVAEEVAGLRQDLPAMLLDALGDGSHLDKLATAVRDLECTAREAITRTLGR